MEFNSLCLCFYTASNLSSDERKYSLLVWKLAIFLYQSRFHRIMKVACMFISACLLCVFVYDHVTVELRVFDVVAYSICPERQYSAPGLL